MFIQRHTAGQKQGYLDSELLASQFNQPFSIISITDNQFIVSDSKNDQLRLLDLANNLVTTVDIQDKNQNTIHLQKPKGICKGIFNDEEGVFICDSENSKIRFLSGKTGMTISVCGSEPGYLDGKFHTARLHKPSSIVQSPIDKTIYISDSQNHVIRYIPYNSSQIYTLCGIPNRPGFIDKTDEVLGKPAQFNNPGQITVLKTGNIVVCDTGNNAIRHIHVGAKLVTTVIGEKGIKHQLIKFVYNNNYKCNSISLEGKYHVFCSEKPGKHQIFDYQKSLCQPEGIAQLQDQALLVSCSNGCVHYISPDLCQIYEVKELVGLIKLGQMCTFNDQVALCDLLGHKIYTLSISNVEVGLRNQAEINMNLNISKVQQQAMSSRQLFNQKNITQKLLVSTVNRQNVHQTQIKQPEVYPFSFENMQLLLNIMSENYSGTQTKINHKVPQNKYQTEESGQKFSLDVLKGKSTITEQVDSEFKDERVNNEFPVNFTQVQLNFELIIFLSLNQSPINDKAYAILQQKFIQEILNYNRFLFENKLIDNSISGILTAISTATGPGKLALAVKLTDSDNLTNFYYNQTSNTFYNEFQDQLKLSIISSYNTNQKNLKFSIFDNEGNALVSQDCQYFNAQSGGLNRFNEEVAIAELNLTCLLHNSTLITSINNYDVDIDESLIQGNFSAFNVQFQIEIAGIENGNVIAISKRMLIDFNIAMSDFISEEKIECYGINKNLRQRVKLGVFE
ncbi:NHL repeat-containing protein [Spironucleus salmonicida]|uniref:NHL repeat-containing protein n=1 Tax=Spironucleus salmonicida TaxID=348837 RepID=V6LFL8_9EUKA|nr:NHL repeat-containing protein [Spironucleus salmonicida]|eukprot:EST42501.1 hypothetical protein SS50377_17807 [Spironucleus salmonicida]